MEAPTPADTAGETEPARQASEAHEADLFVIGDVNPLILIVDGDVVPEFGQVEKIVGTVRLTIGGSSAITACGAARLGLKVAHGGVVGDDLLGRAVVDALRDHGEDRALLTALGTIDRLRAEDVPREALPHDRHLHAGSTAIQPRLRAGLSELFAEARAVGVSTSFDANWDPARRWDDIEGMLAEADVFFADERERQPSSQGRSNRSRPPMLWCSAPSTPDAGPMPGP